MKKTGVYLILILISCNIAAQRVDQNNIPAVVLNAYQLKFPGADNVEWKLDKGNYLVDFRINGKTNKLTLDNKGRILKHSRDLFASEIPSAVMSTIRARVPYFDIHDADRLEEAGKVVYEIDFKIEGKNHLFRVNERGNLLKYRKELKESEIPESIINLINNIYGNFDSGRSKYVEEPGQKIYIVRGEVNDYDHVFTFNQKMVIIQHSQDLAKSEIPVPVLNTINNIYHGYEIRDADLEEARGNGKYIIKLRKSRETIYVVLNSQGKILEVKK